MKTQFFQGRIEAVVSKRIVIAEELLALFATGPVIYENESVAVLDQHAPQAHIDEVVGVGRIGFLPDHFGHNTEHGAAIQFEISSINGVDLHSQFSRHANMRKMEGNIVKENKKTSRSNPSEIEVLRGVKRIRTAVRAFAELCLATRP